MDQIAVFRHAWLVDFEFTAPPGHRPTPLCCVAREVRTGEVVRNWLDHGTPVDPLYGTGTDTLVVAYYASAELGCHLALNWPMPVRVLDLYAEFRRVTSGTPAPCGNGLLGALAYFGLDGLGAAEKEEMRQLAMRGGPYTPAERMALLDYCQTDVDSLARILPRMLPQIDLPRALLRGRYMTAVARVEWQGVPIDVEVFEALKQSWTRIKSRLVAAVDEEYGVFVPVGQRTINPGTVLGAAILAEAEGWGINPYRLAEALDEVWAADREATAETYEARRAARRATGLTVNRIERWESSGKDHSLFPGLDAKARDIASDYPALGIGPGYVADEVYETTDHAGRLWEVLRGRDEHPKPKHHPDLLRKAAELVSAYQDPDFGYEGPLRFSADRWAKYLAAKGIPWPRLDSGALALDDDTFREMARAYPAEVGPIRELRHALSQMKLNELAVGSDGRNRVLLSAFGSRTGRNQPSNSRFIFGPATWLRCLIRPEPGTAVAYIDWSQQELAIAAALSGDQRMQEAYSSGDFYLTFAKMAGAVPPEATKQSHGAVREMFKVVSLGVLYGLSAEGLARRLNVPACRGRELLQMHRTTFRTFWEWSDRVEAQAMLTGTLRTVFGWEVHVGQNANPRSLRNFPMQGNGSEMLRLAVCLATERGIQVCAPIHDALLVEGDLDEIDDVVSRTQDAMKEASEVVLPGFPLKTDAKVVRYPDRFIDGRGKRMWEVVSGLLADIKGVSPESRPEAGSAERRGHR